MLGQSSAKALIFAGLPPVLWLISPSRAVAWSGILAYYLAATRGITAGAAVFFGETAYSLALGVVLYLLSSLALSLPWLALWKKTAPDEKFYKPVLRLFWCYFFLTVPPVGVFGFSSPLLAAGLIFRGWGLYGIAAYICLNVFLASLLTRGHGFLAFCAAVYLGLAVLMCPALYDTPLRGVEGWIGIDTHYADLTSGEFDIFLSLSRASSCSEIMLKESRDRDFVLLPETIGGQWHGVIKEYFAPISMILSKAGKTAAFGVEEFDDAGLYDNTLRFFGVNEGLVYRQRFPVPVSMWRPYPFNVSGTAKAHWFDSGVLTLFNGKKALCLLCYEQILPFAALCPLIRGETPDFIIAASNCWWARYSMIPNLLRQSLISWSSLLGIPYVSARNS